VTTRLAGDEIALRDVDEGDLELFFREQADEEAARMAAFSARDREAHMDHWHRILADENVIVKTVVAGGVAAGNVVSWREDSGTRAVGYWIARSHWGRGIATRALAMFLNVDRTRPLRAHVAKHNVGSVRVLEKCGFVVIAETNEDGVDELLMVLR
jgi:RimJ/RimL family protein N-acetyltransferase